jgi:DNA-binding XRE family transcriptional regulator
MINQHQLVDVLCSLTEDDFKQIEDIIKQLRSMFDDKSLSETLKNKVGVEKMQTLAELVDGKYDEEVTIAMLVSKFK